jgi:hypothetical protein
LIIRNFEPDARRTRPFHSPVGRMDQLSYVPRLLALFTGLAAAGQDDMADRRPAQRRRAAAREAHHPVRA